jgi:hypothetical protein
MGVETIHHVVVVAIHVVAGLLMVVLAFSYPFPGFDYGFAYGIAFFRGGGGDGSWVFVEDQGLRVGSGYLRVCGVAEHMIRNAGDFLFVLFRKKEGLLLLAGLLCCFGGLDLGQFSVEVIDDDLVLGRMGVVVDY